MWLIESMASDIQTFGWLTFFLTDVWAEVTSSMPIIVTDIFTDVWVDWHLGWLIFLQIDILVDWLTFRLYVPGWMPGLTVRLILRLTFRHLFKFFIISQLYDFTAPKECPCSIAYHPRLQIFACGFESGIIRIFNVIATSMIAEQRWEFIFYFFSSSPITILFFWRFNQDEILNGNSRVALAQNNICIITEMCYNKCYLHILQSSTLRNS